MEVARMEGFAEIPKLRITAETPPEELLHEYAMQGDLPLVTELIEKDPDLIDCRNSGGSTALHIGKWHKSVLTNFSFPLPLT
jgi:hypothetical protein